MSAVVSIRRRVETLGQLMAAQLKVPLGFRLSQARVYPVARTGVEDFFIRNVKEEAPRSETRTLDIGCGDEAQNPFGAHSSFGVDIRGDAEKNIVSADLSLDKIPFPDDYFDYVTAFDFIEHVPRVSTDGNRRFPFVELMSEIHRVLKDDGLFFAQTPAYPAVEAFQDPTHVNIIAETTFPIYFCSPKRHAKIYGFKGSFEFVSQEWRHYHLLTLLRKSK